MTWPVSKMVTFAKIPLGEPSGLSKGIVIFVSCTL